MSPGPLLGISLGLALLGGALALYGDVPVGAGLCALAALFTSVLGLRDARSAWQWQILLGAVAVLAVVIVRQVAGAVAANDVVLLLFQTMVALGVIAAGCWLWAARAPKPSHLVEPVALVLAAVLLGGVSLLGLDSLITPIRPVVPPCTSPTRT